MAYRRSLKYTYNLALAKKLVANIGKDTAHGVSEVATQIGEVPEDTIPDREMAAWRSTRGSIFATILN